MTTSRFDYLAHWNTCHFCLPEFIGPFEDPLCGKCFAKSLDEMFSDVDFLAKLKDQLDAPNPFILTVPRRRKSRIR